MVLVENILYFSNPFASELYAYQLQEKAGAVLQGKGNIKQGTVFNGKPLFFKEPNVLFALTSEEGRDEASLQSPAPEFPFQGMVAFDAGVYFFNEKTGDIVKFENPFQGGTKGTFWLSSDTRQKAMEAVSMAIDGNIWILTRENKIQRYFGGNYQEVLRPSLFPFLKQAVSMHTTTNLPYLYLLDPSERRLVLLSKFGDVIAQYTSSAFDNLLAFAISQDGSTAYLLNGNKVYQLTLVQP